MDHSPIKVWLENPDRDYFEGIALFEKYGSNLALVYNLRRVKTNSHEDRLIYELGKLVELPEEEIPTAPHEVENPPVDPAPVDPAPVDPAPVDPAPVDPAPVDPAPVDPEQNPKKNSDLLQELLNSRIGKYAERNVLSDTLADLEGEALKSAAIQVQKIDDEIIALTTQIQFVEQHGHLPVPKFDAAEDLESFKKKKKSLGEKLSRLKKELKTTPGNLKKEAQVEDINSQIAALDLKIKALTQTTS